MRIAPAQIAPVWLQREPTLAKVEAAVAEAAAQGAQLVVFGEALVPGYPFWVELTDGARFGSAEQQAFYAHYVEQAVDLAAGHLDGVRAAARSHRLHVVLGLIERPAERGDSVYCSAVTIAPDGRVHNVHRKLMPTYEERLVWAQGDGHGLRTFALGEFTVGTLNCWENWLPLARAALHAQGEDLHLSLWPGNVRNTEHLARHIALEGRCYSLAVSGLLRREDVPSTLPFAARLQAVLPDVSANGGSCVAAPDGQWLLPPQSSGEGVFVVDLDAAAVRAARHNLDISGHYARPDVLQLTLDSRRQAVLAIADADATRPGRT